MKTAYALDETGIYIDLAPKKEWVIVSSSPQGTYYISAENSYALTKSSFEAASFDNYENALAILEDFKESVFVENQEQEDIVHFLHVEKMEDL